MKRLLAFIIIAFLFALPVCAEEDYYSTQYENVGADGLQDYLDENVKSFFEDNGIDPSNHDWVNNLSAKNVFSHILGLITGDMKNIFTCAAAIIGIILVTASLSAFGMSERLETAVYVAMLAVCAIIAGDIWRSVSASVGAVKGCSTFMLGFIPVFAAVVALSGGTVTAASMSGLLLSAAELVSAAASFVVLPLMGGYLSLSISSGVSPLLEQSGIVESVKKISMWILSLATTLFVGILSIQTAVNAAADGVTMRTARFILGTSVPVAGGALSEAVSTISASVGLLRSSIGIYGVVALAVFLLPFIAELSLWRVVLLACSSVSELFSLPKISGVLKAVDAMLSVLLGILLLVAGMFIISLTVVVTAVKI